MLPRCYREAEEAAKNGHHSARSRESQRERHYRQQQQQQQQQAYFTSPAAAVAAAGVTRAGALGDSRRSVTWERGRSKHALVVSCLKPLMTVRFDRNVCKPCDNSTLRPS